MKPSCAGQLISVSILTHRRTNTGIGNKKTEKIEVVNRDGWKLIDYNGERRLLTTDAKQLRHVWRHDTWVY